VTPYSAVVLASWIVFSLVWRIAALRAKPSRPLGRFTSTGARLAFVLVVFALFRRHELTALKQTTGPAALVGCVLCDAGIAFMMWARYAIGKNWGMPMSLRVDPELVTRGPYAFVRHPIYGGMFVTMLGTALVVPFFTFVLVTAVAYFAYSAAREERDMLAQFPEQYAAYRKRTKMFLPFLL